MIDSMLPAHPLTSFSVCQLLFFDLLLAGPLSDDIMIFFLQINQPARDFKSGEKKIMLQLVSVHKKSTTPALFFFSQ